MGRWRQGLGQELGTSMGRLWRQGLRQEGGPYVEGLDWRPLPEHDLEDTPRAYEPDGRDVLGRGLRGQGQGHRLCRLQNRRGGGYRHRELEWLCLGWCGHPMRLLGEAAVRAASAAIVWTHEAVEG